jgi:hypothetical protein
LSEALETAGGRAAEEEQQPAQPPVEIRRTGSRNRR